MKHHDHRPVKVCSTNNLNCKLGAAGWLKTGSLSYCCPRSCWQKTRRGTAASQSRTLSLFVGRPGSGHPGWGNRVCTTPGTRMRWAPSSRLDPEYSRMSILFAHQCWKRTVPLAWPVKEKILVTLSTQRRSHSGTTLNFSQSSLYLVFVLQVKATQNTAVGMNSDPFRWQVFKAAQKTVFGCPNAFVETTTSSSSLSVHGAWLTVTFPLSLAVRT